MCIYLVQKYRGQLNSGAAGYITKDEVPDLLLDAIEGVMHGEEGWVSKRASKQITSQQTGYKWDQRTLTNREYEVLELLKAKKPNEVIAADLHTDVDIIQLHVESLQRKYGASTRAELIVKASQQD